MEEAYLGTIIAWPINWAPRGWAFCAGQELSIAQNSALFSLLGTYFGGNGTTTFKLPDLRGRMIIGAGKRLGSAYTYNFAQLGGNDTTIISPSAMPVHNHTLGGNFTVNMSDISVSQSVSTSEGAISNPQGAFPASGAVAGIGDVVNGYNSLPTPGASLAPAVVSGEATVSISGSTGNAGAGQPLNVMPPFLAIHYIIAIQGYYPSRD